MATLKNTSINDTGNLRLPRGNNSQRAGDVQGRLRYNTDANAIEYYTTVYGRGWTQMTIPYLTRQIITTAYMQGGYESSVAWNNINKISASTDTTYNLGDGAIERAFNYQWGACSRDYGYVFGAGGGHAVSSNYTIAFNMRTDTQASDISRNLALSRHTFGGVFQETDLTWMAGGSDGRIEEYNMATKTLVGTVAATTYSGATWGMSGETFGIFYTGNDGQNLNYSTRTITTRGGTGPSNFHQQKSVPSKLGYGWAGNEGGYAGGNNFRQTNLITNSTITGRTKPITDCGEENLTLGQEHQYMLGMYNGLQNNRSWRWNYATETGFEGGASMQPKGKPGASSGVCCWRDG
jgi:hypothetical protein